jgi:tetratricopeptide (TPR) repeat protein
VRLYATDRANRDHTPDAREAALRRIVAFYIHTGAAADRLLEPHRQSLPLDPLPADVHGHDLPDYAAALAWLEAEHRNLRAAQQTAITHRWHAATGQLAWALTNYYFRRALRHDAVAVWQAALEAAAHDADPLASFRAHGYLGFAYSGVGSHQQAVEHLNQTLALAGAPRGDAEAPGSRGAGAETDVLTRQAHIHRDLAWAWERQGDHRRALHHATDAVDLLRRLDKPAWLADTLNGVGWISARLGDYDNARTHCQTAVTLHQKHGNPNGEAAALDSLGYIEHHSGNHHRAIDYYQQALDLRRSIGNTYDAASTLDGLGHARAALRHDQQARELWQQALELYQRQHRHSDAERIRQQLKTLN